MIFLRFISIISQTYFSGKFYENSEFSQASSKSVPLKSLSPQKCNCSAWLRLKLNTKIGLHTTNHPPTPTTTQTLRQQYLSCYWPDLDQTLNKGFWQYILQINYNCYHDICPGSICPGDICHYQENLICLWTNFDQTLQKKSKTFQAEHFRPKSCCCYCRCCCLVCCYWSHYIKLWSINVHLGLLKADVEFVWWWWVVVCKVIFVSNPTAVLRLCCCWGCDNIHTNIHKCSSNSF